VLLAISWDHYRLQQERMAQMNIFARPACPFCGERDVWFVTDWKNLAMLVASLAVAFISAEVVPLRWRCKVCDRRFSAIGTTAEAGTPRGFDVKDHPEEK
jgi:hypothetical protein